MTFDVVIIGSGFSGIGSAVRLQQAGLSNFIVIERDSSIGGTWWANKYPGAACDVESNLYSFSFAPHPDWSRSFGTQSEILGYLRSCVHKYALGSKILLNTNVDSAVFGDDNLWHVKLSTGQTLDTKFVISGAGGLSRPCIPDIPVRPL